MPPKRKRKAPTQKQKQTQRQSVVVNIGAKKSSGRKKTSGRGGLPPPSYQHNLAPTFIQPSQQTDYTPLLMAVLQSGKVQAPVPIRNADTPLSVQPSAQQMAGIKAEERRAGPTASNLQPHPSQADERVSMGLEDVRIPVTTRVSTPVQVGVRAADQYYRKTLAEGLGEGGGDIPVATARGEVTSSQPDTPQTKKRKPRATQLEMQQREAEQKPDPRQRLMDQFVTPKPYNRKTL
jgi:hypothetical protein